MWWDKSHACEGKIQFFLKQERGREEIQWIKNNGREIWNFISLFFCHLLHSKLECWSIFGLNFQINVETEKKLQLNEFNLIKFWNKNFFSWKLTTTNVWRTKYFAFIFLKSRKYDWNWFWHRERKREISLFVFGIYGDWEKPQRGKRISGCKSISTNCVTKNHYYNDDDDNNNNDDDSRYNSHTIFIERMKKIAEINAFLDFAKKVRWFVVVVIVKYETIERDKMRE